MWDFLSGSDIKNLPATQEPWVQYLGWEDPWKKGMAPVFFLEIFHGQRSLMGYNPWGCKELDTTELLTLSLSTQSILYFLPGSPTSMLPLQDKELKICLLLHSPIFFTMSHCKDLRRDLMMESEDHFLKLSYNFQKYFVKILSLMSSDCIPCNCFPNQAIEYFHLPRKFLHGCF